MIVLALQTHLDSIKEQKSRQHTGKWFSDNVENLSKKMICFYFVPCKKRRKIIKQVTEQNNNKKD